MSKISTQDLVARVRDGLVDLSSLSKFDRERVERWQKRMGKSRTYWRVVNEQRDRDAERRDREARQAEAARCLAATRKAMAQVHAAAK